MNIYQGTQEYLYGQYVFDLDSKQDTFGKVIDIIMDLENPTVNSEFVDFLYNLDGSQKLINSLLTDSRFSMALLKSLDFDSQTKLISAGSSVSLSEAKTFISLFDIERFTRWTNLTDELENIVYKEKNSVETNDVDEIALGGTVLFY